MPTGPGQLHRLEDNGEGGYRDAPVLPLH